MRYVSTRSPLAARAQLAFDEVLLGGLAGDGGLYVPEHVPKLPEDTRLGAGELSYAELAARIMAPYASGAVDDDLAELVADAYATFDHPEVCPLVGLDEDHWLLELFHGPTFAFKDVALQVVARLFDHELERRDDRAMIVAATSGDTG